LYKGECFERKEGAISNGVYDNNIRDRTVSSVVNQTYQTNTNNPLYFNPEQEVNLPGFYSSDTYESNNVRIIYKTESVIPDNHIYDVPNI
jgi:hypothetical protein